MRIIDARTSCAHLFVGLWVVWLQTGRAYVTATQVAGGVALGLVDHRWLPYITNP